MIFPVILCGGLGSRLWPLSRASYPKQFIDLLADGHSMLQSTALRLKSLDDVAAPLAICNHKNRFFVAEQFQQLEVKPASIILEPVARNTAPAVAIAAFSAIEINPDAVLLVLPADHHIKNHQAFSTAVNQATPAAEQGYLVSFGIVPDAAETGYGYIERGESLSIDNTEASIFSIKRFVEKPNKQTAESYITDPNFSWNSGMFLFRADQYLAELGAYAPEIYQASKQAFNQAYRDLDFIRVDEECFVACPSDSIDYAVMEHTAKGAMLPLAAEWSDVGSWQAIWDISDKDEQGNVVVGDVLMQDSVNSLVMSDHRLVATLGLSNAVVVETSDAVLVADKNAIQDVKKIVTALQLSHRSEGSAHQLVFRPWGSYETICQGEQFQVKRIVVHCGQKLSLQMHHHRAEHWVVVSGKAQITCGEEVFTLIQNQSTYIPLGQKHRLENIGSIPLTLIEIQSGAYLGEDDIVRFDDDYGRHE